MFKIVFQIGLFTTVAFSSLALIALGIPRGDIALVVDLMGEATRDFFFYSSDAPCRPIGLDAWTLSFCALQKKPPMELVSPNFVHHFFDVFNNKNYIDRNFVVEKISKNLQHGNLKTHKHHLA
jgi:hypothetical protein